MRKGRLFLVAVDKDSRVERVTKYLIHEINTGVYTSGQKLPSIEKLSAMLDLGRSTVRESLKELQTLGIIDIKHGGGIYVSKFPESCRAYPLALQTVDARRAIESYCAKYAAETATEHLIETLEQLYAKMAQSLSASDVDGFIYYDRCFHYAIAEHLSNVLLTKYYTSLELLFRDAQEMIVHLPGSSDCAQADHRRIIQAIVQRTPESASEAASLHIDHITSQIYEVLNA